MRIVPGTVLILIVLEGALVPSGCRIDGLVHAVLILIVLEDALVHVPSQHDSPLYPQS